MFEQWGIGETAEELKSDLHTGLKTEEAARRLERDGRNEMRAPRKKTIIESFLEQLNDPLIYVLIVAAAVSVRAGAWRFPRRSWCGATWSGWRPAARCRRTCG